MEICEAILNLSHEEESIREAAIDSCIAFRSTFKWENYKELSDIMQRVEIRKFAYDSLVYYLKNIWKSEVIDVQAEIMNDYPFLYVDDDPLLFTVAYTASVFLAYCSDPEELCIYFDNNEANQFYSAIFTNLIISYYDLEFPDDRSESLANFITKNSILYLKKFIFSPISQLDNNSEGFRFYSSMLIDILQTASVYTDLMIEDQEIIDFFKKLSSDLWIPSESNTISIFEEILPTKMFTILSHSLISPLVDTLSHYYQELFSEEITIDLKEYLFLVNQLQTRLSFIFALMENSQMEDALSLFDLTIFLLYSNSPSIVIEVVNQFLEFFKSNLANSYEFKDESFEKRKYLFQLCFQFILCKNSMYFIGSIYDNEYSYFTIKISIKTLLAKIFSFANMDYFIVSMLHTVSEIDIGQTGEYEVTLAKIVYETFKTVLSDNNIAHAPTICPNEAFNFTAKIMMELNQINDPSYQSKVIQICITIFPLLRPSPDSIKDLFKVMLYIFFNFKLTTCDLFAKYFLMYIEKFSYYVEIPIEEMKLVKHSKQGYSTAQKILELYGKDNGSSIGILKDSFDKLILFTSDDFSFSKTPSKSIMKNSFKHLDLIKSVQYDASIEECIIQIGMLLIQIINKIIDGINESCAFLLKNSGFISKVCEAIIHIIEMVPVQLIPSLETLKFPTKLSASARFLVLLFIRPMYEIYSTKPDSDQLTPLLLNHINILCGMNDQYNESPSDYDVVDLNKINLVILELCSYCSLEEISEPVRKVMTSTEDKKAYFAFISLITNKDWDWVIHFWDILVTTSIKHQDTMRIVILMEDMIGKYSLNIDDFRRIPNATEESIKKIGRMNEVKRGKPLRKVLRDFLSCLIE